MTQDNKIIHFPGLNGLRALAAILVLFAHTTQALHNFGLNSMVFGADPNGKPFGSLLAGIGVSIFFSISGFLITYLLVEERTTGISIYKFYMRRILRIWPLYFLYLFLALTALFWFDIDFHKPSLLYYIFLAANFPFVFGGAIRFLSHYWSLGVEEQFYIFWPWVIKKIPGRFLLSSIVWLCIGFFILKVIFRIVNIKYGEFTPFYFLFINRFDCMMIGAIGAILYFSKNVRVTTILCSLPMQILSWGAILFFVMNLEAGMLLNHEIAALATVVIIYGQIENRNRIFNLDLRLFDFLGKISYGIYVIHPLLIFFFEKLLTDILVFGTFNYVIVYSIITLSTIFLAYLSYEYFEKIFLRMKNQFMVIKSTSTKYYKI